MKSFNALSKLSLCFFLAVFAVFVVPVQAGDGETGAKPEAARRTEEPATLAVSAQQGTTVSAPAPTVKVPAQAPAAPPPAPPQAPAAETPKARTAPGSARISLHLENASLLQVVGIIAAELKMNYVVDPSVKGVVNINTMGDLRQEDLLGLLQTILRANGAIAVQSGSFWRIVPMKDAPRVPVGVQRETSSTNIPEDDRMVMNVVPLSYVSAADMSKILGNYLSEAGQIVTYDPGNVLLITDTSRNMRRLMDLVSMFDTDVLAQQRVRLFQVENSRAFDLVRDLRDIFSAYAMSDKTAVRFLPIERLNSVLVVSGNPKVFPEVEQWIAKLDKPVRKSGIQNFVYKVQNASADNLANVLNGLYGTGMGMTASRMNAGFGASGAVMGGGFSGGSGVGGGFSGGGPAGGGANFGSAMTPSAGGQFGGALGGGPLGATGVPVTGGPTGTPSPGASMLQSEVRIVPDVINNALIVQSTPQDWEIIRQTIKELDIVPRQVMIEAKVYEVTLTGALAFGVEAFLQQKSNTNKALLGQFALAPANGFPNPGVSLSAGLLVGRTRELLTFLNAQENRTRTRIVSAPNILASDNVEARIQVGQEIPMLTSQGIIPGTQAAGSSVFANTIQQRDTGVILSVRPRINSSGLVTLQIGQEVSQPIQAVTGGIQSPSIQKRSVITQATVQDGDTIALGGIISESKLTTKNRVPLLGDIPYLGVLFGSTSYTTSRTELIVLLTPRVLQDVGDAEDVTAEFRQRLKELKKAFRQQDNEPKK